MGLPPKSSVMIFLVLGRLLTHGRMVRLSSPSWRRRFNSSRVLAGRRAILLSLVGVIKKLRVDGVESFGVVPPSLKLRRTGKCETVSQFGFWVLFRFYQFLTANKNSR